MVVEKYNFKFSIFSFLQFSKYCSWWSHLFMAPKNCTRSFTTIQLCILLMWLGSMIRRSLNYCRKWQRLILQLRSTLLARVSMLHLICVSMYCEDPCRKMRILREVESENFERCCGFSSYYLPIVGELPVVADSIGPRFLSGFGGQVDFIRGAAIGFDGLGKPIIALPSATKKGQSKIVPYINQVCWDLFVFFRNSVETHSSFFFQFCVDTGGVVILGTVSTLKKNSSLNVGGWLCSICWLVSMVYWYSHA